MTFHNGREPACFPSAEELRMLRAIALVALLDAARKGEYHASFHGFRVQALRQCSALGSRGFVAVNLCVSLGETVVERGVVTTIDADAVEPIPGGRVI